MIDILGIGDSGSIALLARVRCGNAVRRTYVEYAALSFRSVESLGDKDYLPATLVATIAPAELFLAHAKGFDCSPLRAAYSNVAGLRIEEDRVEPSVVLEWLAR